MSELVGRGTNTQGLLPGLPIPALGMGKGTVEGISPPRWVALSALALDTCEGRLHGALSSQRVESEMNGKCQKGQLLPGGIGQWAGLGFPQICTVQKENYLGQDLGPLWVETRGVWGHKGVFEAEPGAWAPLQHLDSH